MVKNNKSPWAPYIKFVFPIILLALLLIMTFFKISGSSIGPFYDMYFTGSYSDSLLKGQSRGVRTDEWLVTTQLTIAQEKAGYPLLNSAIGQGKDMSLITDVPYREWSTLFKPQNWSFFVMPFENAFAFKWWLLVVLLMLSIYSLALKLLPGKYIESALIATIGSLTPFIFWWYQTITIMPVVWALLFVVLTLRVLDNKAFAVFRQRPRGLVATQLTLSLGIAYTLTSFALVLYPAFQIPIIIIVGLFILGYCLNLLSNTTREKWPGVLRILRYIALGVFLAVCMAAIFVITRLDSIQNITNTVYPGARDIAAGMAAPKHSINFIGFNQYRLQDDNIQGTIPSNQSEVSTFLVISVLFIPPLLGYLYWYYRKYKKIEWVLAAFLACNVIFLAHFFVPLFTPISKLMFLNLVPPVRLVLGFGVLGILSMIYLIRFQAMHREVFNKRHLFYLVLYGISILAYSIFWSLYIQDKFPGFNGSLKVIAVMMLIYTIGLVLIMSRKYIIGLVLLATLSIGTIQSIQPINIGLGQVYSGEIIKEINRQSGDNAVWGVSGDLVLENLPIVAGQKSITGTQFSPDNTFWDQIDNKDTDEVYNRYAHVLLGDTQDSALKLSQSDFFTAKISCDNLISDTVTNILSSTKLNFSCYKLVKQLDYPTRSIYFYANTQL